MELIPHWCRRRLRTRTSPMHVRQFQATPRAILSQRSSFEQRAPRPTTRLCPSLLHQAVLDLTARYNIGLSENRIFVKPRVNVIRPPTAKRTNEVLSFDG
jgi:hypothetical protein